MERNILACFLSYNKLFSFEIINVRFLIWESGSKELDDMLKLLTLCGLFHLHKCEVTDCMPNFRIFCIDLKFYESLCSSLNKKVAKTTVLMEKIMTSL